MPFELDWTSWLTGAITFANVFAVIVMMVHGMRLRRKQTTGRSRARSR